MLYMIVLYYDSHTPVTWEVVKIWINCNLLTKNVTSVNCEKLSLGNYQAIKTKKLHKNWAWNILFGCLRKQNKIEILKKN